MEPSRRNLQFRKFAPLVAAIAVGLATFLVARAQAYPQPPATVNFEKDICYGITPVQSLYMDIARPKEGKGPFPAVVCIHGGGWAAGNKKDMLPCVFGLAQQGFVAASVQYRLVPAGHFPDQVSDVKAAVRYLRAHAGELNIDPSRIGAVGSSAGGHLALYLGTTSASDFPEHGANQEYSSAVKAVVSLAGPSDLTLKLPDEAEKIAEKFIGESRKDHPELYKQASPISYLTDDDAAMLLIHGDKDPLVPYNQATEMADACKKRKHDCELVTIANGVHGGGGKPEDWNASILKMNDFLVRHLKAEKIKSDI